MDFLLIMLVLLPLLGAGVGALLRSGSAARTWALVVSLATAAVAAIIAIQFFTGSDVTDAATAAGRNFRVTMSADAVKWLTISPGTINASFNFGVDAIGMWLVNLTVFLMPLAVAASFGSIKEREKEYYAWMTMLLGAMLGVFVARDALAFYVFFELTLIPMFFIIGIWGGPDRRYAAGKFFLFTFTGSVFTLAAIIYMAMGAGEGGTPSFAIDDIITYAQTRMAPTERFWAVLGLLAGFAIKVPLFPVHTWLPLAHTEAPTAGSVILAGVLLKLGTYGILRLAVPIGFTAVNYDQVLYSFNLIYGWDATRVWVTFGGLMHFMGLLCVAAVIYGALVAWVQQDIKKLVAYSSVSHMGFCVLGLVGLNLIGVQGSVLYMINHGLSTGALFLVVGMIYDRYHTRDINQLSGLGRAMPVMSFFFILFTMSSIGLPGLNGFVSEFLTILGAFTSSRLGIAYGVLAATGVVLGAVYMLHMAAKVIFGPLKVPGDHGHGGHGAGAAHGQADQGQAATTDHGHGVVKKNDLNAREIMILAPIGFAVILLGVLPNLVLKPIRGPIEAMMPAERANQAAVENVEKAPPKPQTVAQVK
jgi:NADH-quinone oxidoreductase subunit M